MSDCSICTQACGWILHLPAQGLPWILLLCTRLRDIELGPDHLKGRHWEHLRTVEGGDMINISSIHVKLSKVMLAHGHFSLYLLVFFAEICFT